MAGGVTMTDLAGLAAGTPLGGSSPIGAISALATGNPIMAGISAISSLFGGSKTNISGAAAGGQAQSGEGVFFGKNNVSLNNAKFDLGEPVQVALIAAGVVGAIYVYKKYLR